MGESVNEVTLPGRTRLSTGAPSLGAATVTGVDRLSGARVTAHDLRASAALVLAGLVAVAKGPVAIVAVILLGFFVSIFFPTLYSLAIEGLGEQTAKASGLLTMGFLGCALLPVLQGKLADTIGLQRSFWVLALPYLFALFYALKGHRLTKCHETAARC